MRNAVIKDATGEVVRLGYTDFSAQLQVGESQVVISESATLPPNVEMYFIKVVSGDFVEMTDAEKLPKLKVERFKEIDQRTRELIDQGFEFPPGSGLVFSLSKESQSNIHGAYTARNLANFEYPVHWLTNEDDGFVDLQGPTDVENFFLTALGTLRAHKDSGSDLKDQIRAAATKMDLDAVVDDR